MPFSEDELKLKPIQVADLDVAVPIAAAGLTIGRHESNGLHLNAEVYPQVSTYHARILWEAAQPVLEDLASTNGTLVNGQIIKRSVLKAGDIIQLGGQLGPRFMVVGEEPYKKTALLHPPLDEPGAAAAGGRGERSGDASKSASGLSQMEKRFRRMVGRRFRLLLAGFVTEVVLFFGIGWLAFMAIERWRISEANQITQLELENQKLKREMELAAAEMDQQRQVWDKHRGKLIEERDSLGKIIGKLESKGEQSSVELQLLQAKFQETLRKLEEYNPIHQEKVKAAQRNEQNRVLASVVFVERKVVFKDSKSGKPAYFEGETDGIIQINVDGKGDSLTEEGSGSGFCISKEGWILTNAHVAGKPKIATIQVEEWVLEAEVELAVVFSGTSKKIPAKVASLAKEGVDVALLKIEAFEHMPFVNQFVVDNAEVAPGAEIRLFGFPLGKHLMQGKEVLTASIFSGIVSRRTDDLIQVQASVYPGNSGGPAVDEHGKVVGIVTAVQTINSGQIASDIGYLVPIQCASKVWPPATTQNPTRTPSPTPSSESKSESK